MAGMNGCARLRNGAYHKVIVYLQHIRTVQLPYFKTMKMLMDVVAVALVVLMLKLEGAEGGKYSTIFSV